MNHYAVPTKDLEHAKSNMDEFGYCIVQDVLKPDELDQIRTRLFQQIEAEKERQISHHLPDKKQLVLFLVNKGKVFRDILLNKKLHTIMRHVLGETYLLSAFHAHLAHQGGEKRFHTDQFWMPPPTTPDKKTHVLPGSITREDFRGHHVGGEAMRSLESISPAVVCNAMWMLDDFTEQNGATIVVPGSHLSGRQPDDDLDREANWVPAIGSAGSAVIFEGRTWHSTGVNRTSKPRIGLTSNFCAPQFRQQENLQLGILPEVLAEISDELKALLGFKPWQGYGAYENFDGWVKRDEYTIGELRPNQRAV